MIDSHTHIYLAGYQPIEEMVKAGYEAVVQCAYIPVRPSGASTVRDLFEWLIFSERERCRKYGLECYVAVGIHPRCAPRADYKGVLGAVEEYLTAPGVVALGEVGLEAEGHVELLRDQLKIAKRLDRPAIIHTPKRNKLEATELILKVLKEVGMPEDLAVVDHVRPETAEMVRREGYWIGLTVQPGKLTVEEAVAIADTYGPEKFLVNSDVGEDPADPLAVLRFSEKYDKWPLAEGNPRKFFRL